MDRVGGKVQDCLEIRGTTCFVLQMKGNQRIGKAERRRFLFVRTPEMGASEQGKSPSKFIYKVKENEGQKDPGDGLWSL